MADFERGDASSTREVHMGAKPCAFCGKQGDLTREHVLPQWLREELADHNSVTPARGRHLFGGDLVVPDVCGTCNSGALSQLDSAAKRYWEAGRDSETTLSKDEANTMARWAAKVCFNAQRAVVALGSAGEEPPMPDSFKNWTLRGGSCPNDIAVSLARMPPDHPDAASAGLFGSNGMALPRRYLQLRAAVFFVSWSFDGNPNAAQVVAQLDRTKAPSIAIGSCEADIVIPELKDPGMVRRGYWNDEDLVRRVTERFGA